MPADLHGAKIGKHDEFYTQFADVEKELSNYADQFADKVVYCNCDGPKESAFWQYFRQNFCSLGLKKLISTYRSFVDIAYRTDFDGNIETSIPLIFDGDFRNPECAAILDEADIVVTNPPFSLFREFINLVVGGGKDFLVISNTQALVYSEVFRLFMDGKIRTGYTNFNVGMLFRVPDSYEKFSKIINGKKYARIASSCWLTSLPVFKCGGGVRLTKKYSPDAYPTYHNYNAIHVDNYTNIPMDFDGIMGVPVTFLDKYDPSQFELLGLSSAGNNSAIPRFYDNDFYRGYTRGKVRTRIESNLPLLSSGAWGGTKCSRPEGPDLWQMYWRVFVRKAS